MKRICLLFISCFVLSCLSSQNALSVTGGSFTNSQCALCYSIGQVFTSTSNNVSEGVMQTYGLYPVSGLDCDKVNLTFSTYPNPVSGVLRVECEVFEGLSYRICSMDGKLMVSNVLNERLSLIDMTHYPNSTYIITIFENKKILKSVKIIKS